MHEGDEDLGIHLLHLDVLSQIWAKTPILLTKLHIIDKA
jgi:hypothetical protein